MKMAVIALILVSSIGMAQADVRVFRPDLDPVSVPASSGLSITGVMGALGFTSPVETAVTRVQETLKSNAVLFPAWDQPGSELDLVRSEQTEDGLVLRFVQRQEGYVVDGAEVVALFDRDGELEVLNTSLVKVDAVPARAELTSAQAVEIAVRELGLVDAELAPMEMPALKLVVDSRTGVSRLVWQFSIRGQDAAFQVQVAAGGAESGRVIRALSLISRIAPISMYDASVTVVLPNPIYKGVHVLENGEKTLAGKLVDTTEAEKGNLSFMKALAYYQIVFKRDSFDNKRARIVASVNANRFFQKADILGMHQNAAWMAPWQMFVFGSGGDLLGSFAESTDVVGHEFTHAVISTTSNLEYAGQSGALNEHLADVFGALIQQKTDRPQNPFLIGAKCLRGEFAKKAKALRDMMDPHQSLGGQPAHVREIPPALGPDCKPSQDNDNCGVHGINGVPNRASAIIMQTLGFDASAPLFYRVMTARLRVNSNFADYRRQMLDECATRLRDRSACEVVARAFDEVGIQ